MDFKNEESNYLKIDSIYAFISVDKDGNEGLCGFQKPDGHWIAMIGADEERLKSLLPLARQIAKAQEMVIKLIKLTHREELMVIE